MSRHARLLTPSPRACAVWGAVLAGVVAGCSDDDDAAIGTPTTAGNVVEVSSPEELEAVLATLGGQTVDDTEIRYTDGAAEISIGGLAFDWPMLDRLDYTRSGGDRNIMVPPNWPILGDLEIISNLDVFGNPSIGVAVFAQTELVTDPESRADMIGSWYASHAQQEANVVHQSELTRDDGVTCWTDVRHGAVGGDGPTSDSAIVLLAGPGFASSAITLAAVSSYGNLPTDVGDLVESICGARPDGV